METKYWAGAVGVGVGPVAVGLVVGVGVTIGVVELLFEHATAIAAASASSASVAARPPGFMANRKRSRALCNNSATYLLDAAPSRASCRTSSRRQRPRG